MKIANIMFSGLEWRPYHFSQAYKACERDHVVENWPEYSWKVHGSEDGPLILPSLAELRFLFLQDPGRIRTRKCRDSRSPVICLCKVSYMTLSAVEWLVSSSHCTFKLRFVQFFFVYVVTRCNNCLSLLRTNTTLHPEERPLLSWHG